jgi:hypothetical protein
MKSRPAAEQHLACSGFAYDARAQTGLGIVARRSSACDAAALHGYAATWPHAEREDYFVSVVT